VHQRPSQPIRYASFLEHRGNVVVTGGAGYIGSHTCKELARAGYAPIAFDNLSEGHRWAVRYGPLIEGDLADTALLRDTLTDAQAVAVVHFAASAYVGESMQDPQKYFRNNVGGTISLLDAVRAAGVPRVVFSSTCATYGTPDRIPIDEDHRQEPVNPYGASKLFVEHMLRWNAAAHGLRYTALRYFNAAGADHDGELGETHDPETHLIPVAILAALGQGPALQIFGTDYPTPDGTAIRDYVHVADLAQAHVAALRHMETGGDSGAFNVGTGVGVSVRQVVECVEAVSGRHVPAVEGPRREGDPEALVADPRRANTVLGWQAQCSDLRTIVDTAWRWHQSSDCFRAPGIGGNRTTLQTGSTQC
jgi:UDP-arabinose 4-epimerase